MLEVFILVTLCSSLKAYRQLSQFKQLTTQFPERYVMGSKNAQLYCFHTCITFQNKIVYLC